MSLPFDEAKYSSLMSRLEAVEAKLSYVFKASNILRIDSTFFMKTFINEENIIDKRKNNALIDLGINIRSFGAYALNNDVEYLTKGVPFIRGINMKNGDIDFNDMIYISEKSNKLLWKSEIKKETILLSMSGTIGDVAIALPNWNYPINSNQDIAKIDLNGELNPYYLYIFLLSRYGQNYLKREARGSVQQHVFLSQIEQFRIPLFSNILYQKIENIIKNIIAIKEQSENFYINAQNLLLSELGLADYTPTNEGISIKTFTDSFGASGRLDAEYYQPKYDEIDSIIGNYKNGFCCVKDKFIQNKQLYTVKNTEHKYIEIGDVNISSGTVEYNIVSTEELPDNAKISLNKGDLIYSTVRPYRGAVALCDFEEDIVVSGAFTVLHEKSDYSRECLFVLLRTKVYQEDIMKYNVGSSYPVVKDDDVLNLKIPKLPIEIQKQITEKVQQSFSLRKKSAALLDCAKQAVEIAIEQSEDVAMNMISFGLNNEIYGLC